MATNWIKNGQGGGGFCIRADARTRVGIEMEDIILHKNEVGGYAYNDAQICITQVKWVLEREMFNNSGDDMKGLASATPNALTNII